MPLYFFHLFNDLTVIDEEGAEFSDLAAARKDAVLGAREMAAKSVLEGKLNLEHAIDIADESGMVLERLRFRDVVMIEA
jgi:hypothetical protein